MERYICKIATIEEIERNWEYLIKTHPNDESWKVYKEKATRNFKNKNTIVYYGILNRKVISEATAILSKSEVQNSEGLVDNNTVYLSAFRTIEEYQGKGYFSKLYKFMENDLIKRGYATLTLGVEPSEIKNIMIYFKYGFTNYIKTAYEVEPSKNEKEKPVKILVNYYSKNLNENQIIKS